MRFLGFVLSAVVFVAFGVFTAVRDFVTLAFSFPTSDHRTSLQLDRLRRSTERIDHRASPFRSFLSRALSHARFIAGRFVDGRSMAAA